MKYGPTHVMKIFAPVTVCMAIVVVTLSCIHYYSNNDGVYL